MEKLAKSVTETSWRENPKTTTSLFWYRQMIMELQQSDCRLGLKQNDDDVDDADNDVETVCAVTQSVRRSVTRR